MTTRKNIMSARIESCINTEGEYQWVESTEEEYGYEWDGDVIGYLENKMDDNSEDINRPCTHLSAIHNVPEGAVILSDSDGIPYEMYWVEEVEVSE